LPEKKKKRKHIRFQNEKIKIKIKIKNYPLYGTGHLNFVNVVQVIVGSKQLCTKKKFFFYKCKKKKKMKNSTFWISIMRSL